MADLATPTDFSLSVSDCPLVQIEGWDGTLEKFEANLSQALGTPLPALVGETVRHADSLIVRVAPRRFWLISTGASQAPSPAVDPELACLIPLGEGRVRFTMTGARVQKVLSACIAVDWHSPAAAPGRALHTSLHHVPVLFIRTGAADCKLIVPRSFATSLSDWIIEIAG
jgi:heterotetrameric sarcosine oxidase gamma subunit